MRLKQVPVVVRYPVGDDVIGTFLERIGIDSHLFRLFFLQVRIKEIIKRYQRINDIFMNHLKGSHPYQCLLVTIIQVDRHIAVVQTCHVHIKDGSSCRGILLLAGQPPEECRIAGYAYDFIVDAFNHSSGFADAHPLVRITLQGTVGQVHSSGIFLIRLQVLQPRTFVIGGMAACSGKYHCRSRCLLTSGMGVVLTFYIYIGGMCVPVHQQTGGQPVCSPIYVFICPLPKPLIHIFCPRSLFNQLLSFFLPLLCGQIAGMSLRKFQVQPPGLCLYRPYNHRQAQPQNHSFHIF